MPPKPHVSPPPSRPTIGATILQRASAETQQEVENAEAEARDAEGKQAMAVHNLEEAHERAKAEPSAANVDKQDDAARDLTSANRNLADAYDDLADAQAKADEEAKQISDEEDEENDEDDGDEEGGGHHGGGDWPDGWGP